MWIHLYDCTILVPPAYPSDVRFRGESSFLLFSHCMNSYEIVTLYYSRVVLWGCSPGWAMLCETAYSLAVVIKVSDSSVHYRSVRYTGNDKEGFWSYYYPVTTPQWLHPAALLACSPASLIRLQRWSNWLLIIAVFRPTGVLSSCVKEGERINPRKPRRIKHSNGFVA